MTDIILAPDAGVPGAAFYVPITNADGTAGWEKVSVGNLLKSSLIAQTTLGAAAASITLSGIPATFTDLILTMQLRGTGANHYLNMQFNGDTGANYDYTNADQFGGAWTNLSSLAQTQARAGQGPGSANTAGMSGLIEINIINYSGTAFRKRWQSYWGMSFNGGEGSGIYAGEWRSTNAINSITLAPTAGTFDVGTRVSLYGRG